MKPTSTLAVLLVTLFPVAAGAARQAQAQTPAPAPAPAPTVVAGVAVPEQCVIGPGDVLGVVFWREKELSGDVAVLPDGTITLPLINEVVAAGLTPSELRVKLVDAAKQYVTDP